MLFLFLRYLHFYPELWSISKFMTSKTGQQIITIHALPNISKSKCDQTITFVQLMHYNTRNIVFEK